MSSTKTESRRASNCLICKVDLKKNGFFLIIMIHGEGYTFDKCEYLVCEDCLHKYYLVELEQTPEIVQKIYFALRLEEDGNYTRRRWV